MKKTRLLEIIREEISGALNEAGLGDQISTMQKQKDAIEKQKAPLIKKEADISKKIADLEKKQADAEIKSSNTLEEDEEQLNEMAYDILITNPEKLSKLKDEIKDSPKAGKKLLYQVIDIIQRDKKENKPIRQRDIANELGLIQQKVNPLVNLLIDYDIISKGESVTGVTKKAPSDKPKKEKPASTGTKGRPAGSKKATLTPGDDGFDKVTYSDASDEEVEDTYYNDEDEFSSTDTEGPSSKDITGDETAKELAQASSVSKDENFDRIRTGLMNKAKKAKGELSTEDRKLAAQIINTAKAKYKFNATQIDALRAVAGL
jgi:hypothetical protein